MAVLSTNILRSGPAFLKRFKNAGPIGVDIDEDMVRMAQLTTNGKKVSLIAAAFKQRPAQIKSGSAEWQRWAIQTIQELTENEHFRGKETAAIIPANNVFIDNIRLPAGDDTKDNKQKNSDKLQEVIISKIKHKLPFEPNQAMIKYITTEDDNAVVMATERKNIDRHLAIYERSNLQINSIAVWPMALINTYVKFFGRRQTDLQTVVMLLDIEPNRTNLVVCRHSKLLFARSLSIGAKEIETLCQISHSNPGWQTDEIITRLLLELKGSQKQFNSLYKKTTIQRLIFLSGKTVEREVCVAIARQLELPTQRGDCLAAVEAPNSRNITAVERRGCKISWAIAFGLSLS